MVLPIMILVSSLALGLLYLQVTCETILRREFDPTYVPESVNAYRLEFPLVQSELQRIKSPTDYARVSDALKCDYLALCFLLRNSERDTYPWPERLLRLYFRVVLLVASAQHILKLNEKWALGKLVEVLHYFAGTVAEQGRTQCSNVVA